MPERRSPPAKRGWRAADLAVATVLVSLFVLVGFFLSRNFDYSWDWRRVIAFLLNVGKDGWRSGLIATGFANMLRLVAIGGVCAALFGVLLGLAGASRNAGLKFFAYTYVETVRSLPLVVFVFVFYYFVSSQILPVGSINPGTSWIALVLFGNPDRATELLAGAVCLALYEAAYVAEIVRGGLNSVTKDIRETARSLGLSRLQSLRLVILPLSLRRTVPPLTSQVVLLVKDSSVMSIISVQELTYTALEAANSTLHIFEALLLAALLYFIVCYPMTLLAGGLELRSRNGSG